MIPFTTFCRWIGLLVWIFVALLSGNFCSIDGGFATAFAPTTSISTPTSISRASWSASKINNHVVPAFSSSSLSLLQVQQQQQQQTRGCSRVTTFYSIPSSVDATADDYKEHVSGTATIPQEIFSLVKNIVGAGVLGLPAGIAAFGNAPGAVLPALLLIAAIGGLSAYGFALIGRVCALTSTTSYRDAWSVSVSEDTSWLPAVSVTLKTMCAILAYSMILAETSVTLGSTWIPTLTKPTALISLTTLVLLPLCLLRNLSSLAPFSLVGSLGMVYTALAMAGRWWDKSYKIIATTTKVTSKLNVKVASKAVGVAAAAVSPPPKSLGMSLSSALRPRFGDVGAQGALTPQVAIFIGMLSTAYMAHFNAPKFYTELKQGSPNESQVRRFAIVVATSFAISVAIFGAVASFGFLTFGAASSGVILNNYAAKDVWMTVSRWAVTTSLIFSYPLAFLGFRDGVLDLFQVDDRPAWKINALTVGLLSFITALALVIPDVGFVLSFAGATLGNALIYIFPAFMFRGAIEDIPEYSSKYKRLQREVKFAFFNAGLGAIMGLLGAKMAIQSFLVKK